MAYELTKQLREEHKGKRQALLKRYVALAHNMAGVGHVAYVVVLR